MNFKIIETQSNFPDVLLYRDRDENGNETVNILAIGTMEETDNMFAGETMSFADEESAQRFIVDYSEFSACRWCEKNKITF